MRSNPKNCTSNAIQPQKIHHKCDPTRINTPQKQSNHHKCNPILNKYTTIVRVYRSSFCSSEIFWNLLTLRNMLIWYLSGFCIWRRLAGRGDRCLHSYKWSLLGSNSHPPHHPSPKCVYFLFPSALFVYFSILYLFVYYVVLTLIHMLTPTWIWTPKEL